MCSFDCWQWLGCLFSPSFNAHCSARFFIFIQFIIDDEHHWHCDGIAMALNYLHHERFEISMTMSYPNVSTNENIVILCYRSILRLFFPFSLSFFLFIYSKFHMRTHAIVQCAFRSFHIKTNVTQGTAYDLGLGNNIMYLKRKKTVLSSLSYSPVLRHVTYVWLHFNSYSHCYEFQEKFSTRTEMRIIFILLHSENWTLRNIETEGMIFFLLYQPTSYWKLSLEKYKWKKKKMTNLYDVKMFHRFDCIYHLVRTWGNAFYQFNCCSKFFVVIIILRSLEKREEKT